MIKELRKKENGKVTEPGSAIFFTEIDEDKAIGYLDQLKARYVITDDKFSQLGHFNSAVKWIGEDMNAYLNQPEDSLTRYDNSMLIRLHFLDGSETLIEKKVNNKKLDLIVKALRHFRILYESGSTVSVFPYKNVIKEIKAAKVFEYVKGAKIKGSAPSGIDVTISTEVVTNQGRKFIYENKATAKDGIFEFVVPYSTGIQENSDVSASNYTIKIGNYTKSIKVSEEDILQGKTIQL